MLINLKLKNIALIEIIEINFEKGLNIFTGDSGSGKSLILDSLNVLFGGNNIPTNHLIRPGKEDCLIQAKFFVTDKVKEWLIKNAIQNHSSEIIIIRKSFKQKKKIATKFFVNNVSINKKIIESLGILLIDFAGQSDSLLFETLESRKQILDDLGLKKLEDINLQVKNCWDELVVLEKKQIEEVSLSNRQKENNFFNKEMLKILDDANLESFDEISCLKKKEALLANNFEIRKSAQITLKNLISYGTEDLSVSTLINNSIKQLNRVSDFDFEIRKFKNSLITIQNDVENLISSLTSYFEQLDNGDIDLEDIQNRLFFLRNLERTFSSDLSQLIQRRNQLRQSLVSNSHEEKINKLKIQIQELKGKLDNLFCLQTFQRRKIANQLQKSVMEILKYLGLRNAKFSIEFEKANPSSTGTDNINFLFSANPDQQLAPLSKIISGGEMSRFLLAIKSIISQNSGSFFLDEIDSGLSGKSLYSLVELIKKISDQRQVLCITHQPLLAASAKVHFKVAKKVVGGLTFTSVSKLSAKTERQRELSELIGGGFEEANDYASTLIDKAAA